MPYTCSSQAGHIVLIVHMQEFLLKIQSDLHSVPVGAKHFNNFRSFLKAKDGVLDSAADMFVESLGRFCRLTKMDKKPSGDGFDYEGLLHFLISQSKAGKQLTDTVQLPPLCPKNRRRANSPIHWRRAEPIANSPHANSKHHSAGSD